MDEWIARWQDDLANLLDTLVNPNPGVGEDWRDHLPAEPDDVLSDWVDWGAEASDDRLA